jgi:hypothetical protein
MMTTGHDGPNVSGPPHASASAAPPSFAPTPMGSRLNGGGTSPVREPGRSIGSASPGSEPGQHMSGPLPAHDSGRLAGGPPLGKGQSYGIGGPAPSHEPEPIGHGPVEARYPGRPLRGEPAPHPYHPVEGAAPRHEPEPIGHGPVETRPPGWPVRGYPPPQPGRFPPGPVRWTEPGRPGWPRYRADRPGFYRGADRRWIWDRPYAIDRGRRWPWLYRAEWVGAPNATVRWVQACLAQLLGPGVPQDGILGVLTQNAIRQFQAQQQMPATGMLDGDTIAAIRAACGEQEAVAYGGPIEQHDVDEPYPRQPWPPSRRFNPPPAQTIPTGRYQTRDYSPCDAVINDFDQLAAAADGLKAALVEAAPDPAWVANRADAVTAVSREIVARLSSRSYLQVGCTREDLEHLASNVDDMRGPGGDPDIGSWPPARTAREQGPRSQARQSLRHLLNWCRRAARLFPNI